MQYDIKNIAIERFFQAFSIFQFYISVGNTLAYNKNEINLFKFISFYICNDAKNILFVNKKSIFFLKTKNPNYSSSS